MTDGPRTHLSKSRVVTGWQCPRQLWLKVFQPDAPELQPSVADLDRMHQGTHVGELATEEFPGGVEIDFRRDDLDAMVDATRRALEAEAPAIFEASFRQDDVFVAVDILERREDAFGIIEVKATTKVKDSHIVDAAVQYRVVTGAGLSVDRVEIMHLNTDYREGEGGSLFVRRDVTDRVMQQLESIDGIIDACRKVLGGDMPAPCVHTGGGSPKECPLESGCWPDRPGHITDLPGVGPAGAEKYLAEGIEMLDDLPEDVELKKRAARHLAAWRADDFVIEPTLGAALEPFSGRLGFLDFETIMRAVPPWPGLKPYEMVPVQFSYHERQPDGSVTHTEWLAEPGADPRRPLAEKLLAATRDADRVAMYTPYEVRCIKRLKAGSPELAGELDELIDRMIDLAPVVRKHVAHPAFRGSASIKYVLTPLVPDLTYEGLPVADGMTASVQLASLLLDAYVLPAEEIGVDREALVEYCTLDTLAMVRLLERLEEMANSRE